MEHLSSTSLLPEAFQGARDDLAGRIGLVWQQVHAPVIVLLLQVAVVLCLAMLLMLFVECVYIGDVKLPWLGFLLGGGERVNVNQGKWLGSRQIRCNWATKGAGTCEEKQNSDTKSVVELTNGSTEDGQGTSNDDGPENNPNYTTVYVGNLSPEVTQLDLHRYFHALGAGTIEEVRVQQDKGFGFVRYSTHAEAALAIQMGNAQILCGKPIKCSWGNKPTPPGTGPSPLPPPVPFAGLSAGDLLAYERQMALSKMGAGQALMHAQSQHALKQAAMGMGAAPSQAIYDGGYPNMAAAQQLYY